MMRAALFAAAIAVSAPPTVAQQSPADPACNPQVADALEAAATQGVETAFAAIRDPEAGIRDPMSILDFSCVANMFDYRLYNIFFDPQRSMSDILGVLNRKICAVAREAYRAAIGRPATPDFIRDIRRLPGVQVRTQRWNLIEDVTGDGDLDRLIVGGG